MNAHKTFEQVRFQLFQVELVECIHFKMAAWGVVNVITKWIVQWRDRRVAMTALIKTSECLLQQPRYHGYGASRRRATHKHLQTHIHTGLSSLVTNDNRYWRSGQTQIEWQTRITTTHATPLRQLHQLQGFLQIDYTNTLILFLNN